MKTILITGSNGLLGQKLVYGLLKRNAENNAWRIIATARGENRLSNKSGYEYVTMDIGKADEIRSVFKTFKPDVVINTAAMTNVDACESKKEEAELLNATSVKFMTEALREMKNADSAYDVHFIHLSTDFIFDGTAGPYTEEGIPNPLPHFNAGTASSAHPRPVLPSVQ